MTKTLMIKCASRVSQELCTAARRGQSRKRLSRNATLCNGGNWREGLSAICLGSHSTIFCGLVWTNTESAPRKTRFLPVKSFLIGRLTICKFVVRTFLACKSKENYRALAYSRRRKPSRRSRVRSHDCTVRNITSLGARLEFQSTASIPSTFELTFDAGRTLRVCHVVWRTIAELGVEFLDPQSA